MIAVFQLCNKAYGYELRKYILEVFKREFTYGNLYSVLYQLNKKGFVSKSMGESTESRRGKKKIYYSLTPSGLKALKTARDMHRLLWSRMPEHTFDG
jgi:DNA-binding PadR family transcriptional regulator